MFPAGAGEVDLIRVLNQKVTSVVSTVIYFLITVTPNALPKIKFVTVVAGRATTSVGISHKVQIVRVEIQQEVQVMVEVE